MLNTTFIRVSETDLQRLKDWISGMEKRKSELKESYEKQGTRHELFYVLRDEEGPILLLISELRDIGLGSAEFLRSDDLLDQEFKNLITEIGRGSPQVELPYDSSFFYKE